jgi:hypothetical protein
MSTWLAFSTVRNECLRLMAGSVLLSCVPFLGLGKAWRILSYSWRQRWLRRRYAIDGTVPIRRWDRQVQDALVRRVVGGSDIRIASSSGSTATPKRIPYTRRRLRTIRRMSFETVAQAAWAHGIRRPSLFVLSSLLQDGSLSSLLLEEGKEPLLIGGLILPSRHIRQASGRSLVERFGPTAVRLWMMAVSSPSILYATNPSTLAVFLDAMRADWARCRRLASVTLHGGGELCGPLADILPKAAAPGWRTRLTTIAELAGPRAIDVLVPSLRCFCCWDGGYVGAYLERVSDRLGISLPHVPMYSMSTECIETRCTYVGGRPRYLPDAPGLLYEFLREDDPDEVGCLLKPHDLQSGGRYTMIVSDAHGLVRYQTEDVFECVDKVRGVPDLRFLRRRGLTYSFTGEKLTGAQVEIAIGRILARSSDPAVRALQACLVPRVPRGPGRAALPHYVLVLVHACRTRPRVHLAEVAGCFERELSGLNAEFAAKRASARLDATRSVLFAYDRFAECLTGATEPNMRGWDTQFKIVPLYNRLWSDLGLPVLEAAT